MAEKVAQKAIRFNSSIKAKAAEDGERRIVFVASSSQVDRDSQRVDVPSLRLPLKAGGSIRVEQIGSEGVEGIDIPLMLNHSFDVTDVIGSVRKAWFENGELIFEAGLSKREIAQEILTLIEEGHLSNAFSITMSDFDYDYDTETISNAEVIEVSVVFRGSNKEARLLTLKSLLGGEMSKDAEPTEANEFIETPKVEEAEAEPTVEEPKAEAEEPAEATAEEQGEAEEANEAEEQTAEESEPVEETEEEEPAQEQPNNEDTMEKSIAQDEVVAKATAPVKTSSNYLESKQALIDFKNTVLKFHRGSNEQIMKAWMENIKSKAIAGDGILPSRIEQIFFKTWTDKAEILDTFRTLGVRAGAVYAMKATANGEAKTHAKGATKLNQELEAIRRDLKGIGIYKKLPIDLQDLFDDETGELLAFRVEELAGRVAHAIVVGAIVGGYKDANGRGLFSMVDDLDASVAQTPDDYSQAVATVINPVNGDTEIAKAIRTCGAVKGARRILIVPAGWMTDARIALISMNYPIADIAEFVGADEIHELDELVTTGAGAVGYDMVAYGRDTYVLAGEANATTRTDFDLTTNQDVMLVERYVAGSATGYKNVAGYKTSE